jgi:glycosyltransferase involved in cell wall biosynthesis
MTLALWKTAGASARVRQAARVWRNDGARALTQRVAASAYRRVGPVDLGPTPHLFADDIADSARLNLAEPTLRPPRGAPLTIAWVIAPPSPGSGGHTTLFRMVEGLEASGHRCTLVVYDRFRGEPSAREEVIRRHWPTIRATVVDGSTEWPSADAYVATSWETAHALASRSALVTRRFYFVQDFEPYFYPRGTEYALAEDTYRFGFTTVAVGHMVADHLRTRFGTQAAVAEFGCDTTVYRHQQAGERRRVVLYAKPGVPRRGYGLAVLGLDEFHRRHPEYEIHVFGDPAARLQVPAVRHGGLAPEALSELYNSCAAGLAMSFTNISLAAEEMLACGAIPVVNDHPDARLDFPNPYAEWARPTPSGIAEALCRVVERPDLRAHAAAASQSVRRGGWGPAQAVTRRTIEHHVYGE